jgi:hypothetical protein
MRVMGLAGRGVAAMGLLVVGLTACQLVAGIEDIELTSGSSAAAGSSGSGTGGTTGASSSSSLSSTGSSTASASSTTTSSSASGGGPITVEYPASVSDCINPTQPDTSMCAQAAGSNRLRIDTQDISTGDPWYAYLRFDLDNQLAGRTPTKITLQLTTTSDSMAPSDKSGEIWEVGMFDHNTLTGSVPANMVSVAGDLGAVVKSTTYSWNLLPTSLAGPGKSVYLQLLPLSSDFALYWGKDGTTPPKLIIDAQ